MRKRGSDRIKRSPPTAPVVHAARWIFHRRRWWLCLLLLVPLAVVLATGFPAGTMPAAAPRADGNDPSPPPPEVVFHRYRVVTSYPHDRRAFTQGLVYEDGSLYEGTGQYGQSAIILRDLDTGEAVKRLRLPRKYFGEGITVFGDRLIQLTWKSQTGFLYAKDQFTPQGEFTYETEGWGLTHDGTRLIMSDGTSTLRFLDPNTYAVTGRIEIRDRGRAVPYLNELEYVDGRIYANVWPTWFIAVIDAENGRVTGWIDLRDLYSPPPHQRNNWVLNGIAYRPETKHLLVTGKYWPKLYEIELIDPTAPAQ